MFPDAEFLGLDLYFWMIVAGILAAMIAFRMLAGRVGLSANVFNFSLLCAMVGIGVGYVFAVLFQSWYAYLASGKFEWGVGATFYGGLIGGVAAALALYFGAGRFLFRDRAHIRQFGRMISSVAPCVALAHAFGRIGCLFAGCCYGAPTDSPIGIVMFSAGEWGRRIPVQLFEAVFLFALFAVLLYLLLAKKCEYTASIYLIAYGVWRFAIEYARDDAARGSSGLSFLTPSQLTAILAVIAGTALIFAYKYRLKKIFDSAGGGHGEESAV